MTLSLLLACACGPGCHLLPDIPDPLDFPASKARNLDQLHNPDGSYRYHAILLGDLGYLTETLTGKDRDSFMTPSSIESPSGETLQNLVELLEIHPETFGAASYQIEWCARLGSQDSSELVRERAVMGLGSLGKWLELEALAPLAPPGEAVGPDGVGAAIEGLVRAVRLANSGTGEPGEVAAACAASAQLSLDHDGAWRLLRVVNPLLDIAPSAAEEEPLTQLMSDLRRRVIGGGIFAALSDPSDMVRAAGLRAMVQISGPMSLTGFLSQPLPGWSETIVLGIVDLVSDVGLPSEGLTPRAEARCLSTLLTWSVDHPSPRVRVRAMIALQRVVPQGPRSLREEDWYRWQSGLPTAADGSS